ncbi:P-selectin glycoprotein ligand 1 [Opisthocomus hoazin]|uniref:P-selectin glycoprotein ligand 1 n=1 Tax=Opisthocomus hoazin TaxID=30419 RepID=UPI003F537CAD
MSACAEAKPRRGAGRATRLERGQRRCSHGTAAAEKRHERLISNGVINEPEGWVRDAAAGLRRSGAWVDVVSHGNGTGGDWLSRLPLRPVPPGTAPRPGRAWGQHGDALGEAMLPDHPCTLIPPQTPTPFSVRVFLREIWGTAGTGTLSQPPWPGEGLAPFLRLHLPPVPPRCLWFGSGNAPRPPQPPESCCRCRDKGPANALSLRPPLPPLHTRRPSPGVGPLFRARLPFPARAQGGGRPATPLALGRCPAPGAALVPPVPSLAMAAGAAARGPATAPRRDARLPLPKFLRKRGRRWRRLRSASRGCTRSGSAAPTPGVPTRSLLGPQRRSSASSRSQTPVSSSCSVPPAGPMAPGWATLAMLALVLSTLRACGAVPPPERGGQWVWGPARDPLPLSRRKRADGGQQPGTTAATPGHGRAATAMPESNGTAEPDPLLGSAPPPSPSTNASLHWVPVIPTTADPLDETDSPELLPSSAPSPSTNASLHWVPVIPTTADPLDETDSPELLPGSAPHGTQAEPQKSIATIPGRLPSPGEEGTAAGSTDSSSSVGPRSATPPALSPTTTGSKKVQKAGATPAPTHSTPRDAEPGATAVPLPWDPSGVTAKCLLAILLLALVAATFMVCTGVLGALLWRRARTAHHRLSSTEMVCISSLLPDGEVPANGPKPGAARRPKLLRDSGSEADGDNLTLNSFLPERS